VFRFANLSGLETPVLISPHQGLRGDAIEFIDSFDEVPSEVGVDWNYFIVAFDLAGNYAVSDTVSFILMDKPILMEPTMGALMNNLRLRETWFTWEYEGTPANYRFLIFEDDDGKAGNLVWSYDSSSIHEPMIRFTGTQDLEVGRYLWRVDVKGWVPDENGIIRSGAKSVMRPFEIVL
jgi:hypothetical protein